METKTFKRTYSAGMLSKLIKIRPVEISIQVNYEADSDKDNKALLLALEDSFVKYCKNADKWFIKDVSKLVSGSVKKLETSTTRPGSNLVGPKAKLALELQVAVFNKKMSTAFDGLTTTIAKAFDKVMADWNNRNKGAAVVKVKRAVGVTADVATIVYSAALLPVRPDGAYTLAATIKKLAKTAYLATQDIDDKRDKVVTEIVNLANFCDVLANKEQRTWKQAAKVKLIPLSSVSAPVAEAITQYELAIIKAKSEEKKLGTAIRKLEKEGKAEELDIIDEITKLIKLHEDLEAYLYILNKFKAERKELVKKNDIRTWTEDFTRRFSKKVKPLCQKAAKKLASESKEFKLIEVGPVENTLKVLDKTLKLRKKMVRINL